MTRATAGGRPGGTRIRRRRLRLPTDRPRRRMALLLGLYLLALAALGARLVQIQVVDAEGYRDRGIAQRSRTIDLQARRGRIYDRNGDVLATSVDSATIYADPRAFRPRETPDGTVVQPAMSAQDVAAALAPLLGADPADLTAKLTEDTHFVYLARQLDWDLGERIMALDLPGVDRITEPHRVYPNGSLAAQVVGFTGIDGNGLEGLELAHDGELAGTPGQLAYETAPQGLTIATGLHEVLPAEPGTDLVLTIDREIQAEAERAAREAMVDSDALGASVVVLDIHSGDVLAMASAPGFDPSHRDGTDISTRRNRAVTDVFEPGSVQKAVTVSAALEEGVVAPDTTYPVDDHITIGPKTFHDAHRHPLETMTIGDIIEASSNVGTMEIAEDLGAQRLYEYLQRFGYTRPPGVGFPGESAGLVPDVGGWWVTSLPTIAIGQGVAITLLHAASVYATIGNDGEAVTPRIVRGTVDDQGELEPAPLGEQHRVISPETAREVRTMLTRVVDGEHGTGRRAAVPGYDVAGKTGTARKPLADGRGYSTKYIGSFVGLAPASDPQLVVAVMVDEPTPIYGGVVAAPVFSRVMDFALRARHVPPTRPQPTLDQSLADAARAAADAAAAAAAASEGPATSPNDLGAPPVGSPAGGDGAPVARGDAAAGTAGDG